ncbi:MAG: trypsin-like serine peptidase [bacterium]
MKFLLITLFLPLVLEASIFNGDSRYEARQDGSPEIIKRARSVPAIFRNSALKKRSDGDFDSINWSPQNLGFCSDANFAGQPHLANCSATLITPDLVLTAAHCLEQAELDCSGYKIVFDFALGQSVEKFSKDQVYDCKEVVYYKFDQTLASDDLAIIRLDRRVNDRSPIPVRKKLPTMDTHLSMIGYPLGLPQKADDDGKVLSIDSKNVSFKHDLDTFSCNSGGPIFDEAGQLTGVLVRGTGPNQTSRTNSNCYDWSVAGQSDYAEANSIAHLKKLFKKLGVKLN